MFALQADRFVRPGWRGRWWRNGGGGGGGGGVTLPPALVVALANNDKDVTAFRDKQRYLAEDVSLT